jgi:hypothetical protein
MVRTETPENATVPALVGLARYQAIHISNARYLSSRSISLDTQVEWDNQRRSTTSMLARADWNEPNCIRAYDHIPTKNGFVLQFSSLYHCQASAKSLLPPLSAGRAHLEGGMFFRHQ